MNKFIFYVTSLSAAIKLLLPVRTGTGGRRTLILLNRYSALILQSSKIKGFLTPPSED